MEWGKASSEKNRLKVGRKGGGGEGDGKRRRKKIITMIVVAKMTIVMNEEEEEKQKEEKILLISNDDDGGGNINFISFTACYWLSSNITEYCHNEQGSIQVGAFFCGRLKSLDT